MSSRLLIPSCQGRFDAEAILIAEASERFVTQPGRHREHVTPAIREEERAWQQKLHDELHFEHLEGWEGGVDQDTFRCDEWEWLEVRVVGTLADVDV
eukprot:768017-Hanusia_phi.AAC.3